LPKPVEISKQIFLFFSRLDPGSDGEEINCPAGSESQRRRLY
jgi:hypothetical protein